MLKLSISETRKLTLPLYLPTHYHVCQHKTASKGMSLFDLTILILILSIFSLQSVDCAEYIEEGVNKYQMNPSLNINKNEMSQIFQFFLLCCERHYPFFYAVLSKSDNFHISDKQNI